VRNIWAASRDVISFFWGGESGIWPGGPNDHIQSHERDPPSIGSTSRRGWTFADILLHSSIVSERGETRLFLVRHGETVWNQQRRIQGHLDSPLTDNGRRQAEAIAGHVRRLKPAVILSSDLGRCMETASIIGAALSMKVTPVRAFREKSGGIFEGYTWPEIEGRFPVEHKRYVASRSNYRQPGAESWEETKNRVFSGLDTAVRDHRGKRIVVVTHGGTLHALIRSVLGIPDGSPSRFEFRNGALHTIVHKDAEYLVETLGDMSHIEGESLGDVESK